MKHSIIIINLFLMSLLLPGCRLGDGDAAKAAIGGWCSAGAYCTACSNCSACKNCHVRGGTCSVCCPSCYERPAKTETRPEKPTPMSKPGSEPKQKTNSLQKQQKSKPEKLWIKP